MKEGELKLVVTISISIAVIIGMAYIIILGKEFNLLNVIKAMCFGITPTTFFWLFYFSIGWKLWVLKELFYRPNLSGTWSGTLKSDWKNENGEALEDIEFYIVIRQSFLRIHFTTFTDSFIGTSYSETLSLRKETGLKSVAYLYRKETSQDDNEALQEGASELRLIESVARKLDGNYWSNLKINEKTLSRKLEGKYWSNRKTNGKIDVSFLAEEIVDSYNDAKLLKNNE